MNAKLDIVETVDGYWMVLQGGQQVGGNVDKSGAGDLVFHTWKEAYDYAVHRANGGY